MFDLRRWGNNLIDNDVMSGNTIVWFMVYIEVEKSRVNLFSFLLFWETLSSPQPVPEQEEEIEAIVKKEAKVDDPLHENFDDKPVDVVAEHCVNHCNKHCIENPGRNFTNRSETYCHRKRTRWTTSLSTVKMF